MQVDVFLMHVVQVDEMDDVFFCKGDPCALVEYFSFEEKYQFFTGYFDLFRDDPSNLFIADLLADFYEVCPLLAVADVDVHFLWLDSI